MKNLPPAPENTRPTVLIVDDEAGPRDALKVILRPFFNIRSAENAAKALDILNTQHVDLIALDQKLPDRQGIDLLQDIKQAHAHIEVIIITGHGSVESAMEGIRHGAAGYLLKPFNVTELITLVNQTLGKKRQLDFIRNHFRSLPELWRTEQDSSPSWEILKTGYTELNAQSRGDLTHPLGKPDWLPLLSDILESTGRQLLSHSSRVSFYATTMGARLTLTNEAQHALMLGAFLHDIGKTRPACDGSSEELTLCSSAEALWKEHPMIGSHVVKSFGLPAEVSQIVLYHHERWDGQGFPHGIDREQIPLLARIVSIAQTFDHLTAGVPGQPPFSADQAILNIARKSHTQFDPLLTDVFCEVMNSCKASLPSMAMGPAAASGGHTEFQTPRIIR